MDPDVCLQKIRELIADANKTFTQPHVMMRIAEELAEHFEALDEWISKGGFLPADWHKFRTNDAPNMAHVPECPECGAPPTQAHDPVCSVES